LVDQRYRALDFLLIWSEEIERDVFLRRAGLFRLDVAGADASAQMAMAKGEAAVWHALTVDRVAERLTVSGPLTCVLK
jgi:glycine/D-amino acid oxidase-like deaminating enzyme